MSYIKILSGEVIKNFIGEKAGELCRVEFESGNVLELFHDQDCCECVVIEDIQGEPVQLIGKTLEYVDEEIEDGNVGESSTRTTYTFKTSNYMLKIIWLGESNGYYSESVTVRLNYKTI